MPFVSTPHLRMHYRAAGEGPRVLVFIHGSAASGRVWEPVLPLLPPGFRAIAPDLRGFGASDKPEVDYTITQAAIDLRHVMWELDLTRFVLVGHGLGAAVALEFAVRWPHRVVGMVLVSSPPLSGEPLPAEAFPLLQSTAHDRRLLGLQLAAQTPGAMRDHLWEQMLDDALAGADAVVPYARALSGWSVLEHAADLHQPAVFICGEADPRQTAERLAESRAALPKAELRTLPGSGPMPMLEQPGAFAGLLTDFLARHAVPEGSGTP